eukprot:TRINITY_DN8977_c0_g1_i1.p1 TRINITY_DN8977_c0_g1~~TRINITY_DN8977_c0_g1_i1.p1  ORF type:complete len:354 (-),score=99.82 TRINITY_DN8977_c0_g1_i1:96-1118(-)
MTTLQGVQANRTDFAKGKVDPKVTSATTTSENMKKATPILKELVACALKYHGILTALAETGQQLNKHLEALSKCYEGDSAAAVQKIATTHRNLDLGRSKVAEEFMSKVIVPVGAHFPDEHKEVVKWQADYKKKRTNSLSTIRKYEDKAKKTQKKAIKNPALMDPILASLEESVKSHDALLGESLKEIRLMERKRVCSFVSGWADVVEVEAQAYATCRDDFNNNKEALRSFSRDSTNIGNADAVIRDSRPNLEQLSNARQTGYYDPAQMANLQDYLRQESVANLHDLDSPPPPGDYPGGSGGTYRASAPPPPGAGPPPPGGRNSRALPEPPPDEAAYEYEY